MDEDAIGPFRAIADVYLQLEMVEVGNDVRRNIFVMRFAGMGEQVGDRSGSRSGRESASSSKAECCIR